MKFIDDMLKLYAITDRSWIIDSSLAKDVEQAILGGATMIQLREKKLDYTNLIYLASEIRTVCNKYNVPLIINDDVDVAIACNADGVHIGQSDTNISIAREKLGADKIIGVTAKTVEQAIMAEKAGANYLGSGAVFGSSTKIDATHMELELFSEICNSVKIPVCAIGGINKENMQELKDTGLKGVALVSSVFAVQNIKDECIEINNILNDIL